MFNSKAWCHQTKRPKCSKLLAICFFFSYVFTTTLNQEGKTRQLQRLSYQQLLFPWRNDWKYREKYLRRESERISGGFFCLCLFVLTLEKCCVQLAKPSATAWGSEDLKCIYHSFVASSGILSLSQYNCFSSGET